jgi:drug/metabolite transporter (DMT)-like permease
MLTLPDEPRIRNFLIEWMRSSGRCFSSTSLINVTATELRQALVDLTSLIGQAEATRGMLLRECVSREVPDARGRQGARTDGLRPFYSRHIPRHALRGAIHGTGVMLWFYAVTQIPLAEVTALSFISPIFVAIGASLFLGEQLTARRIIVIAIGIIGVLIILRPGTAVISFGAIAMLIAAPLFAASKILTKSLVKHDSATTIVAYLSVFATLTMLIPALFVWQTPTLNELCWLFATALFATLSHLCLTRGLALVDVTVAQPVEFLQLVWSTLLGVIVFDERPSIWVWLGAGVIVASATYIVRYEARGKTGK